MSKVKEYFKNAGGIELIKMYWRNGVLGTAVSQFILLGRSKTALEILRLSVVLKTKLRIEKKYRKVLKCFDEQWQDNGLHKEKKIVWLFWWQGEEAMPPLVRQCYISVKKHLTDWEIVLLTEKNYIEYADLPDYIKEKQRTGVITLTHFSDLLRLELLIKHGGLWMDATVLCTSGNIPRSILNSDLFVYISQKPGADGDAIPMSSWLMWSKTNNRILMATQTLLYKYWEKNNSLVDYFLLHHFMSIVMEYYPEESNKISPFCNSIPHILQLHLFDKYDDVYWNDLKQMTCFHKLTYKLNKELCIKKGTYYEYIMSI